MGAPTPPTQEIRKILDDMWYSAYQRVWNRPIGQTATVTVTHRMQRGNTTLQMYAVVRPFANFDPNADVYNANGTLVELNYKAKLGLGGNIIRAGYVIVTS